MKWILGMIFLLFINGNHSKVEVIKFAELQELLNENPDKITVINFWATWCKPCIQELPQFEEINKNDRRFEVILISLDDVENLQSKVEPFLLRQKIATQVKLLDETDYNAIIDKIHPEWSGAIPATLILELSGKKHLFEKEFKDGELQATLKKFVQ